MKYQIIRLRRGYAVRNIMDGYIEAKCKTLAKAQQIANQMNGGTA